MRMAGKNTPKNLTIFAKVDGSGQVTTDISKINASITGVATNAKAASSDASELGGAFAKISGVAGTLNSKLAGAGAAVAGMTNGIRAMSGAIGGVLGMFGPWITAINLAVTAGHWLYDVLTKEVEPAQEKVEPQTRGLAAAYMALGENATWAAAQIQLAADAEQKAARDRADQLDAEIQAQKKLVAQLMGPASRLAADAEQAKLQEKRGEISKGELVDLLKQRDAAQKNLQVAKEHLKTLEAKIPAREAELAEIKKIEADKKAALDAEKKKEKEAEDAKKAAENAQREREAAARAAAEKARQQTAAEIAELANLRRAADEAVWVAEEHSEEENFEREIEFAKQAAEAKIKDAYRLAEALDLIEQQFAAKKEKREADARKKELADRDAWLVQAEARSSAALTDQSSIEADPRIKKLNDEIAALQQDEQRFLMESQDFRDQYAEQYIATTDAIIAAERQKTEIIEQLEAERTKKEQEETKKRVKAEWSLSDATKEAMDAQIKGLEALSEASDLTGKGAVAMKAAQMTAAGLQAVADAADYAAEAAANYAIGNIGTAIGLTAASAGKTIAAASYAKGLLDLGFSAFDSGGGKSASPAQTPTSSGALTGQSQGDKTTEIAVTMMFAGNAGRLGRYLIEEINAEGRTAGGARVNSQVLR